LGPCISAVSREEYRQVINQVVLFLEGRQEVVVQQLRGKMAAAAEDLEFEKAAMIRDQIQAVENVIEKQKMASAEGEMDIIAFAQAGEQAYAMVFFVRNGKLLGKEHFILTGTQGAEPSQVITGFVQQFYSSASYIPREILLQYPLEDASVVGTWLESLRGARVKVLVPHRGVKKDLVNVVAENARRGLEQMRIKLLAQPDVLAAALDDLEKGLSLPRFPHRVEGYDVSNIQGAYAVGSMVVFEAGLPKKAQYRRFRIRAVEGANDYAMIQEVLRRRFKRGASGSQDSTWTTFPDLVLIDGGKGQLNAALESMKEVGVDWVPCASIAKENEAVFLPGLADPVMLPHDSAALYFLQRIRDEAHRFALGYFHKVHRRSSLVSSLDAIPGIGAKRKRALLRRFGSAKRIKEAPLEEVASVKGMSQVLAERVRDYL
ncbi:MAG: excinuclease ABC subunit UvrC, partial [Chloroflexi bacterium]|nr:excinuclease ABC subunit UvrC [Chloroflexota bacterium]